jgi:hypothetical protein
VAQSVNVFGDGHLNRPINAARLRLFPQEENHEETEQSGDVVCLRCARNRRWRPIDRQLAQWHFRTRLEERHQRTVLARCQLDACNGCCAGATAPSRPPLRLRLLPPLPLLQLPPRCPLLPPQAPRPAPAPQPPAATKVTYAADAFFDFDKSVLKPEGKAKLDDLTGKVKGINLEVIIAVGHTDSVGS